MTFGSERQYEVEDFPLMSSDIHTIAGVAQLALKYFFG
jgi:hypothetical protein